MCIPAYCRIIGGETMIVCVLPFPVRGRQINGDISSKIREEPNATDQRKL